MMNCIHVLTQTYENYSDNDVPYWKPKGGRTHVITGFNHPANDRIFAAATAAVEAVRASIECDNSMFQETIIDWALAPVGEPTYDEKMQLEYDGKVTYPCPRIALPVAA